MITPPEQAAVTLERQQREADHPPMPVRVHDIADVLMTARTTWRQPTVPLLPEPKPIRDNDPDWDATMRTAYAGWTARNADRAKNPLRELAHALLEFADQLDADGHVPLGINLTTSYEDPSAWAVFHDSRRTAAVTITARGVRRAWITDAAAAAREGQ